jgi:cytochrome c oxidase subunit II
MTGPTRTQLPPSGRDGRRARRTTRRLRACGLLAAALTLAGCSRQSILTTHSRPAHNIALLWWWMLAAAVIVFLGAIVLLFMSYLRRKVPGLPFVGEREWVAQAMVLVFGIGVPLVALVALFAVADIYLVGQTSAPAKRTTSMTINVIGHQWWWEVHYPGTGVVTANEIHIPVDTRINLVATTADVIHSFWVPSLNRKIDMIPGRRNRILLESNQVGVFRGQCSQFCGFQHAHMSMRVFAQTPARFRAWLADERKPGATPSGAAAQRGRQEFMSDQCASCHTIAGTPARGLIGPNLTHLATRTSLAADMIPNDPYWLKRWIRNPQAIKPGDRMPDLGLPRAQINDIVAYLDQLK